MAARTLAGGIVAPRPAAFYKAAARPVARLRGRGAVATSFGSDEDRELGEPWKAKFLTDEETGGEPLPAERPENSVLLAKEKFWGRIAVLSLGAVLLSERLSGKGIVTALNLATGVPVWEIEPALGLSVCGLLVAAIYPWVQQAIKSAGSNGAKAVLTGVTWTNRDRFQVTTGRLAFLALAGTILAEATTGKGILALLNIKTGVEITEIEAGLTFLLLLLFTDDIKSKD